MPTQLGTIWVQWVGYSYVTDSVQTYTIHPANRNITAETAIAIYNTTRNDHRGETGITEIVSNGIHEAFHPPLPRIQRSNVTSITFRTASGSRTDVYGRHVVYYRE